MKSFLCVCILLSVFSFSVAIKASENKPARQILGITLAMNEEQIDLRLRKIGTLVRAENGQEVWKVQDPTFSHVIVGFGKDDQLRYITAVARTDKGAKPMAYSEVGEVKNAHQIGDPRIKNFQFEWELEPEKGRPSALVLAMGRDPKVLSTLTLKNPDVARKDDD